MAAKAVIDTQMIVRGIIRRRRSAAVEIFDAAVAREKLVGITSPFLLDEVERVLRVSDVRRLCEPELDDDLIRRAATLLAERFDIVAGEFRDVDRVPDDAKDNPLVEAALEGNAEAIVSDDRDLLSLKVVRVSGFRPVQVYAPGPFLRLLLRA